MVMSLRLLVVLACSVLFTGSMHAEELPAGDHAQRLAETMWAAETAEEANATMLEALERAGVGVYNIVGQPVVVGNERDADDFYFYDFEVQAIAEAFIRRSTISLDHLAHELRRAGIHIAGDDGEPAPVSAGAIERALRQIRTEAEDAPDERDWFIILLIDALGEREERPFDLLEDMPTAEPEEGDQGEGGFAAGFMEQMMRAQLEQERREALAEGDAEGAAMIERMMEDEEFMAAVREGDTAAMMRAALGEEGLAAIEEARREMDAMLADSDTTPEQQRAAEAHLQMVDQMLEGDGEGMGFGLSHHEARLAAAEANLVMFEALKREAGESVQEAAEQARHEEEDAIRAYQLAAGALAAIPTYRLYQHHVELAEHGVEELEVEVEAAREAARAEAPDDARAAIVSLPWEEEEDGSNLELDSFQAVLIAIDLLFDADGGWHDAAVRSGEGCCGGGLRPDHRLASAQGAARPSHQTPPGAVQIHPVDLAGPEWFDPCAHIGRLQARYPRAFGHLAGALHVARETREVYKAARDFKLWGQLKEALGHVVVAVTVDMVLTVRHIVDGDVNRDAGMIHLKHHPPRPEDRDSTYIKIGAEFIALIELDELLREAINEFGPHMEVCGPLRTFAGDLAEFAKALGVDEAVAGAPKDLADVADLLHRLFGEADFSGTSVWFGPAEAPAETRRGRAWQRVRPATTALDQWLHIHMPEWHHARIPRLSSRPQQKVEADNRVVAKLYPNREKPDVGGRIAVEPLTVEVVGQLTDRSNWYRKPVAALLGVAEDLAVYRPVRRLARVHVEHHVPQKIVGRVELTRTVTESGTVRRQTEREQTEVSRTGSWTLKLTMDEAVVFAGRQDHLAEDEPLRSAMEVEVKGDYNVQTERKMLVDCHDEEGERWLTTTAEEAGGASAEGSTWGWAPTLAVNSRDDTYVLDFSTTVDGIMAALIDAEVDAGADLELRIESCDGVEEYSYSLPRRSMQEPMSATAAHLLSSPPLLTRDRRDNPLARFYHYIDSPQRPTFPREGPLRGEVSWRKVFGLEGVRFVVQTQLAWDLERIDE